MPRTPLRQEPGTLQRITAGPWVGITDSFAPGVTPANRLRTLTNGYIPMGPGGQAVVGRPGIKQVGAQLGTGGTRTVQYLGQFTTLAGVRHTICICGGKFYTLNWGTETWTETLTGANLSGAAITLSTSSHVYSAVLNDRIIFSDSTNTPWMWDGTGGGGLTKLTNAPVFYGPIWTYYAKLFGVKQAERNTFVWSEEADPTTGYEAGGYNNAWSPLGATRLYGGTATNAAFYIHEENRWIRFTGAVSTDFQTAGTRSDVSERVGSVSQALTTDDGIVFLSSQAEPYLIRGSDPIPGWEQCITLISTVPRTSLDVVRIVEWPEINAILIGMPTSGQTVIKQWVVMRIEENGLNYIGRWELGANDCGEVVLNGSAVPTFMVSGNNDGYVYQMGNPDGSQWTDAFNAATVPIAHSMTTGSLSLDIDEEMHLDRCTIMTSSPTAMTGFTVGYQTPRGVSTPMVQNVGSGGGALLGSSFILGTSTLAATQVEQRVVFGWNGKGRWVEVDVGHGYTVERFGVTAVAINAYPWRNDPLLP